MAELSNEMMRLQLDVAEDTKTRLKLQAVREGVTMSDIAEKALKEYLDKVEKSAAKGK